MQPYQLSSQNVLERFHSNAKRGLTKKEVSKHQKKYGTNALPEKPPPSWLWIFISQFQNPLIYILLAAAMLIFFFADEPLDAFIISGVLFFNAIVGTIQEGRTANILSGLSRFITSNAIVIRDGKKQLVDEKDIVVGDILVLQEGERIPADARIIENNSLKINESVLTGESLPVRKTEDAIETPDLPVADQKNMVFKGTFIVSGWAKAVVVATGINSELGKIHAIIEHIDTDMPLKKELDRLSYWLLFFILGMCVFLFGIGYWMGRPVKELIVMLTALFICVIPEGLPIVLTLVLVTGVYRMAKHKVLVKRMQAVEGLGRAQVIVVDKTGTLTRNEMMVCKVCSDNTMYSVSGQGYYDTGEICHDSKEISVKKDSDLYKMAVVNSLLNSTEINFDPKIKLFDIKGEPTEAALFVFSKKAGLKKEELEKEYKKIYEIPFDSRLRYHAGFYEHNGKGIAFVSGSPEEMIARSANGTNNCYQELLDQGLRVVASGQKEFDLSAVPTSEQERTTFFKNIAENKIHLLGFCGIEDAIRPEVYEIVRQARNAGIRIVMATGDHQKTAMYVAKKTGVFQPGDMVISGPEFQKMSEEEHLANLDKITVYSRVTPQDKLEIITDMRMDGTIVAMTGDGVNDAPSLIAADLGIAMGNIGTEVAKDAADIILLDDSFVNIIDAVEQGRHIFYTLKRVVLYFFATNFGEIIVVFFGLLLNMPLPITAAQILWLNLVTDGFLDIGLSMEPQESGLLEQKSWLTEKIKLVDWALIAKMLFMAVPMGIGSIWVFSQYYQTDLRLARTMTLLTMAMFQWFNAWNCRSMTKSIFQLGLFSNIWLIIATGFVLFLQFMLLYTSSMQYLFKTVPLNCAQWSLVILVSCPILFLEEIRKWVVRKWFTNQPAR